MKKSLCILFIALFAILCYCFYCPGGNETFAKKSLEFEVISPKDARNIGMGICLAEYEGREIIVCSFRCSKGKYLFQAYDMVGKQLQIPENTLAEKASSMLNARWICADCFMKVSEDSMEVAMWRRYDENGQEYDKDNPARIVWTHHFSDYTDFDEKWANLLRLNRESHTTWYMSVYAPIGNRTLPSLDNLSLAVMPLWAYADGYTQIWGVDRENGEEKFTVSTRLENSMISDLYFNSTHEHVAVLLDPFDGPEGEKFYSFFQTREDFSANIPLMEYRHQEHHLPYTFANDAYFVTDDVFCFGGRHNSFLSQEFYAVIYSFSKNKVIAKIRLGSFLSMHCEPWGFPWCAISKDGKKLVLGYLRSARLSSSDFKNFIRVYELEK